MAEVLRSGRNFHNSALEDIKNSYLKQYAVSLSSEQKVANIILEASVRNYAYIPLMIVAGNYVSIITIVGALVGESLTNSGINVTPLTNDGIDVKAIVENGRIRIKCTFSESNMPVTVYSLRNRINIRDIQGSVS